MRNKYRNNSKLINFIKNNYKILKNEDIAKKFNIPINAIWELRQKNNLKKECLCGCKKLTYGDYAHGHNIHTQEINEKTVNTRRILTLKRGYYFSPETCKNMSTNRLGENNPAWDINALCNIKRQIRKRDNYICLLCGLHQEKNKNCLDVHHINYDENNNLFQNLISLCHSCHAKTNKSKKDYWTQHFYSILSDKYNYKYSDTQEIIIEVNSNEKTN